MTVKEMISKLITMDPETEVFGYNIETKDDFVIEKIESITRPEHTPYTQADGCAESYIKANNKPAVILSGNMYTWD